MQELSFSTECPQRRNPANKGGHTLGRIASCMHACCKTVHAVEGSAHHTDTYIYQARPPCMNATFDDLIHWHFKKYSGHLSASYAGSTDEEKKEP